MYSVTLRNGVKMPLLGYGVLQMKDQEECGKCVLKALQAGYRMFDTAAAFGNERAVGTALKSAMDKGIVRREDLFIITKLWLKDAGEDLSAGENARNRCQQLQPGAADGSVPEQ